MLWFFVPLDGGIAEELGRDPRVMLTYADLSDNFFVALRGTGQILKDRAKVKELWNRDGRRVVHRRGPDDPTLALLRIDVDKGDYWDPGSSKLVQFFSIAKSALTRTPPKNAGEHREFRNLSETSCAVLGLPIRFQRACAGLHRAAKFAQRRTR